MVAALGLTFLVACRVPSRPYGHPEYLTERVPAFAKRDTKPPGGSTVLVLGAIDDESVSPHGGAYDEESPLIAPLDSTFTYFALPEKILDGLHAALVSRGLVAYKDYLDLGAPVPYPAPSFPAGLLVLRSALEHFGWSRNVGGTDVLSLVMRFRLLTGDGGAVAWTGKKEISFRTGWPSDAEPFDLLADALAAELLGDPAFRAALWGTR